jgi:DNA-binding transcriptional LysR family regulator
VSGQIDAAILTLPIDEPRLRVEPIGRDRLVACLRIDHPLAQKATLRAMDLQDNLTVLYHPQRHPGGHARLLELLGESGVEIDEFSRASHPSELQSLVKTGYGLALIREGTALDTELTTRPVVGVDWNVDTAFVYNKELHPKTIPLLVRHMKRRLAAFPLKRSEPRALASQLAILGSAKRPPRSENNIPYMDRSGRRA